MKTLNESILDKRNSINKNLDPVELTKKTLENLGDVKKHFDIRPDGSVDCNTNLILNLLDQNSIIGNDGKLLIRFHEINGYFEARYISKIKSAYGFPQIVHGPVMLDSLQNIESLKEWGLQEFGEGKEKNSTIISHFNIYDCPKIKNFKGIENAKLNCNYVHVDAHDMNITDFQYFPLFANTDIYMNIRRCQYLTSLKGIEGLSYKDFELAQCPKFDVYELGKLKFINSNIDIAIRISE